MRRYRLLDRHGEQFAFRARDIERAKQRAVRWLLAQQWAPETLRRTIWPSVVLEDIASGEQVRISITVHPRPPECTSERRHRWTRDYIVGGVKMNPGVWAHVGGVVVTEVCRHCGCVRRTDTGATDPETGRQGLTQISYQQPR